jgi:hypothetical protein
MSEEVKEKHPGGRPTKYKEEYNEMAFKLCLLGAIDKDLANFFDVEESTVNKWKIDYPKFSESIKKGKDDADAKVAQSLYHRALGYEHPEEKIFCSDGEITTYDTVKHYPPETAAAIFWLKNRQSKKWRDKVETEITGKDGGPMELHITVDYGDGEKGEE